MSNSDGYKGFYCLITGDEHRCKRIMLALSYIDAEAEFADLKNDKAFCGARRDFMEAIDATVNANYHAMPSTRPELKERVWGAIDVLRTMIQEYIERDGFVSPNLSVPRLIC